MKFTAIASKNPDNGKGWQFEADTLEDCHQWLQNLMDSLKHGFYYGILNNESDQFEETSIAIYFKEN